MNPKSSKSFSPDKLSITDWSVNDRPREKYAAKGAAALSDAELIAILLRTGNASETAVDLAKRLLSSCHNQLNTLSEMTLRQLTDIKGIGQAKATALQAAFELGCRIRSEKIENEQHILYARDVMEIMQGKLSNLKHEEFWAIYLNQASKILKTDQIGKGGITATIVDIRLIMQDAILLGATAIIVCHNHPSGALTPSEADLNLTRQIKSAAEMLNIKLLDHIIMHKTKYYSFEENKILV